MGGKVRKATVDRVPYIGVVGDKEMEEKSIAIKSPKHGDFGNKNVDDILDTLNEEIRTRSTEPLFLE